MEEREATRRLSTTTVASSELSGLYEILTQWNGEVADPEMAASWAPRAAPRWAPFCGHQDFRDLSGQEYHLGIPTRNLNIE